jgi:hypothetical protein
MGSFCKSRELTDQSGLVPGHKRHKNHRMARSSSSNSVERQTGHQRIRKLDRFLQRPEGQHFRTIRLRHRPHQANHIQRAFWRTPQQGPSQKQGQRSRRWHKWRYDSIDYTYGSANNPVGQLSKHVPVWAATPCHRAATAMVDNKLSFIVEYDEKE